MSRVLFLSLAAALVAASAASAQTVSSVTRADPAAEPAPRSAKMGDPDRRDCKTLTPTGSRLGRAKICKTAREWAEQEYEHRKDLERLQTPRTPDQG